MSVGCTKVNNLAYLLKAKKMPLGLLAARRCCLLSVFPNKQDQKVPISRWQVLAVLSVEPFTFLLTIHIF